MTAQTPFRRPILSSVYTATAIIVGGFGSLSGCVLLMFAHGVPQVQTVAIGTIVTAIIVSIVMLGVAQVCEHIGRIAYHAERIDALLSQRIAANQVAPATPSIRTATPVDPSAQRLTNLSSSATAACPNCMAELDVRTLRTGRNTCPACKVDFIAE